jgi:hypothetical protein
MEPVDLDRWMAEGRGCRREVIRALLQAPRIRRRPRDPGEVEVFIKMIRARRERWERQGILRQVGPRRYEMTLDDERLGE